MFVGREDNHDGHDDYADEEVGKGQTQNEIVRGRRQEARLELDCQQYHSVSFFVCYISFHLKVEEKN